MAAGMQPVSPCAEIQDFDKDIRGEQGPTGSGLTRAISAGKVTQVT